jgi:hypothetical protein
VLDSTAVLETARRGSIPRRDAFEGQGVRGEGRVRTFESPLIPGPSFILGVWWIAYDPAKVGDQVRLLTRIFQKDEGGRMKDE